MNTKEKEYVYIVSKIQTEYDAELEKDITVYKDEGNAINSYIYEVDSVKEYLLDHYDIPTDRDDATDDLLNESELYENDTYGYFTEHSYSNYFKYTNYDGTKEIEIQMNKHEIH